MLGAETPEEVIAFAVAIRSAEPAVRESLESRTLVTRTEAAARFLAMHSKMVFIATGAAESLAGVLAWTPMNSCAQAVTREGQPAELLALVATVAFRSAARPCA